MITYKQVGDKPPIRHVHPLQIEFIHSFPSKYIIFNFKYIAQSRLSLLRPVSQSVSAQLVQCSAANCLPIAFQ